MSDTMECEQCGGTQFFKRTRKPKILSYLLFVSSFVIFLAYTSNHKLHPTVNVVWFATQLGLGIWAAIDRRQNASPLFYCRTCSRHLSFLAKS